MSLLKMSFSGTMMVAAIVIIRGLAINRLPKKTFLVLWDAALARLLIPYCLPSALSVYSLIGRLAPPAPGNPAVKQALSAVPGTGASAAPIPSTSGDPILSVDPWMVVWLIGAVACTLYFIVTYLKCWREFQTSLPVDSDYARTWREKHKLRRVIQIRQSDKISTPLTYGVFYPVILMPKTTDWNDRESLKYVLAHEYVHICRFDAVVKLALTAALCVHWFNPAVWLLFILANRDVELSCDEAVVRMFGGHAKSAYALTLIRMEETRSGFSPLCSNFSKTAIEERIIAIMKMKKTSLAALSAAAALVVCVTTAFATSEKSPAEKDPNKNITANAAQTTIDNQIVTSYIRDADGVTYYSVDGGETWAPIEVFLNESALNDVQWWSAEEYAAWLEQEKTALQSIIGERGWTPTTGWFTWTQELVDETIAQYEQTLKNIQAGLKISKPMADGDTMIQFGYDPTLETTETDTAMVIGSAEALDSATGDPRMVGNGTVLTPELLSDYKAHGLTYDEAKGAFYFHGKLVRYFFDGYTFENGIATIYDHVNEDGVVDVHTVRQMTQNADGSSDPGGKLVGIVEYSREEFDSRVIMAPPTIEETAVTGFAGSVGGTTFAERFAKYKDFGITYVEVQGASGRGNVYFHGRLVSTFSDVSPDGGAFSFTSADEGGIAVRTVYDPNGQLIGVETI